MSWLLYITTVNLIIASGHAILNGLKVDYPLFFPEDDGILAINNPKDFEHTLRNSPKPWLVEFYSSWCGDCITFAPIMKKIGKRVKKWFDAELIGIAVFNCAEYENVAKCYEHEVTGYPTLKTVQAFQSGNQSIKSYYQKGYWDHESVELTVRNVLAIIDNLLQDYRNDDQFDQRVSNKFPAINFVNDTSEGLRILTQVEEPISDLTNDDQNDKFQNDKYGLAPKTDLYGMTVNVIMDLHEATNSKGYDRMTLARMTVNDFNAIEDTSVGCHGCIFEVPSKKKLAVIYHENELSKVVADYYNEKFQKKQSKRIPSPIYVPEPEVIPDFPDKEEDDDVIKRRRYTIHVIDAESSMIQMLRLIGKMGGQIKDPVGNAELNVTKLCVKGDDCYKRGERSLSSLQSILDVFVKYFPKHKSTEKTHEFLDRTRKWVKLKAVEEGKSFYSDDFSEKLVDIAEDVGYDMPYDYIGCMGSRGEAFNYTSSYYCGLWTLWHLLTVQRFVNSNDDETPEESLEVLHAMHQWALDFFRCLGCRNHFYTMSQRNPYHQSVKSSKESVLWLWDGHNQAACRQTHPGGFANATNDPVFPKFIFPGVDSSAGGCPDCHKDPKKNQEELLEECEESKAKYFQTDEVFEYLVGLYNTTLNWERPERQNNKETYLKTSNSLISKAMTFNVKVPKDKNINLTAGKWYKVLKVKGI